MSYQVQLGDTIAKVTELLKTNWKTLRRLNPDAIGRSSKTGNWFLKEGAVVKGEKSFASELQKNEEKTDTSIQITESDENKDTDKWLEYTIKPGDTLWTLAVKKFHVNLKDLLNDNNIENPKKIQPGQTIRVRFPTYPEEQEVVASWYGENYHGRLMANGDYYNMYSSTIAHKDLPFGTKVELENLETGQIAEATVTDRGPYIEGRDVDLSLSLAKKLSIYQKGVGRLKMRVLG